MLLREILQNKGSKVLTIAVQATLAEVVERLVKNNCGSLVVCEVEGDPCHMVGIITERDILRACADRSASLEQMKVGDRMSKNPVTCHPDDSIQDAMGVMTERRIRHLPIVERTGQAGRHGFDRRPGQIPARSTDHGKPLPEDLHSELVAGSRF